MSRLHRATRSTTSVNSAWTADALLELGRSYQAAAVFAAAADLDLFDHLAKHPLSAEVLARRIHCNHRGLTILLDALAALRLLIKRGKLYTVPPGADVFLTADGTKSILSMAQHQANCLRNWVQLARVVKNGNPAVRTPSVRGSAGDAAAFIAAVDVPVALTGGTISSSQAARWPHHLHPGAGDLAIVDS